MSIFSSNFPIYKMLRQIGVSEDRVRLTQKEAQGVQKHVESLASKMNVASDVVTYLVTGKLDADHVSTMEAQRVRHYLQGALDKPSRASQAQKGLVSELLSEVRGANEHNVSRQAVGAVVTTAGSRFKPVQSQVNAAVRAYRVATKLPAGPARRTAVSTALSTARRAEATLKRTEHQIGDSQVGRHRVQAMRDQLAAMRPAPLAAPFSR